MNTRTKVPLQRIETIRAFNRFYTQRIGVLGGGMLDSRYTLTEVRVLYEIAHREQPLAMDLVRDLGLDPGYLSRILRTFENRGWLRRTRSSADARKSFLALTPKGKTALSSLEQRSRNEIDKLLHPLPASEQVKLQGHLQNVQALLASTSVSQPDFVLREHRAGDMGWIIQQHGVLYAQEYGWNSKFEALVAEICATFLRDFDPARERCWIAERDGVPVGCVMLVRHSGTVAKLRLLLVEPSQRGLGLGQRLVSECIRFAREADYRTMTLWTQSILTSARRIYEEYGFKLIASEPHETFGTKLTGETWELSLR
jgi:DNA-binding MarR family transcriptional regulator/GNAT superfamily N-acetyltransferase